MHGMLRVKWANRKRVMIKGKDHSCISAKSAGFIIQLRVWGYCNLLFPSQSIQGDQLTHFSNSCVIKHLDISDDFQVSFVQKTFPDGQYSICHHYFDYYMKQLQDPFRLYLLTYYQLTRIT